MRCDTIWRRVKLATMQDRSLGVVENGVLAQTGGRIVYAGAAVNAPELDAAEIINCDGLWMTPGLITAIRTSSKWVTVARKSKRD